MSTPERETDRSLWQRRIQRNVPTMTPKEHLERLRDDIDTVLQLQLRSFSDESWLPVADALAEYGFGVIRAWMHTGQIYSEVARSGYGALPPCPSAWLDEDTVQELAGETVVNALNHFKFNVLMKNKWDARKREPACRRSS